MSKNLPMPLDPATSPALSRRHALSAMAIMPLVVAEAATADDVIARLLAHTQQANAALMRGDAETYREMVAITDDFTLMSPFGGEPSKASQYHSRKMGPNGAVLQERHAQAGGRPVLRLAGYGGSGADRAGPSRGRWAARAGVGVARHARLPARRDGVASGSSSRRPAGHRH